MKQYTMVAVALAAIIGLGFWIAGPQDDTPVSNSSRMAVTGTVLISVELPETLSPNAQIGKQIFDLKCAVCHGANAGGQQDVAPSFVQKIYEPSHHGDLAFLSAVRNGVQAHHWDFGNMPPVEGLTDGDVKMVVAYVRELQRANGIN